MAVQLNHTIVSVHDSQTSAAFLADILGLPAPTRFGPFVVVATDNGVSLDFLDAKYTYLNERLASLGERLAPRVGDRAGGQTRRHQRRGG